MKHRVKSAGTEPGSCRTDSGISLFSDAGMVTVHSQFKPHFGPEFGRKGSNKLLERGSRLVVPQPLRQTLTGFLRVDEVVLDVFDLLNAVVTILALQHPAAKPHVLDAPANLRR